MDDSEGFLTIEHVSTTEDELDEDLVFDIKVKSGEFSGRCNFWILKEEITIVIKALSDMYELLSGSCRVEDCESDAYFVIETNRLGHICIFGQIGGSHQNQYLKFLYRTDQAALPEIISSFRKPLRMAV